MGFCPATAWIRKRYEFFSKLFKPHKLLSGRAAYRKFRYAREREPRAPFGTGSSLHLPHRNSMLPIQTTRAIILLRLSSAVVSQLRPVAAISTTAHFTSAGIAQSSAAYCIQITNR
jgi:hypothetical protein